MWQNTKPIFLRQRLFTALALSASLHAALIFGIAVPLSHGDKPITAIEARLVPLADALPPAPPSAVLVQSRQEAGLVARTANDVLPVAPEILAVAESSAAPYPERQAAFELAPSVPATFSPEPFPVADPEHYAANEVEGRARPLVPVEPVYPQEAQARGISGKVVLLLLVDEMGSVSEAKVVAAEPQGYFEDSALTAFRRAPFVPAQKSGKPVKSRMLLQVRYEQESASRQIQ